MTNRRQCMDTLSTTIAEAEQAPAAFLDVILDSPRESALTEWVANATYLHISEGWTRTCRCRASRSTCQRAS